jgi:hypothetical protein
MGKKSLLQSTSAGKKASKQKDDEEKKKTAQKKAVKAQKAAPAAKSKARKKTPKKAAKKAAPKKAKATAKKTVVKKAKPAAKKGPARKVSRTPTQKKVVAKKAAAKKPVVAPKAAAPAPKPVSRRELLMLKFDHWRTTTPYKPSATVRARKAVSAPPYIKADTPEEEQRIRQLLFEKIDLAAPAPEAVAPQKAQQELTPATPEPAVETAAQAPSEPPPEIILPPTDGDKPLNRMGLYGACALIFLIVLIVGASYNNHQNFYLKTQKGALEIWQGAFAPMGQEALIVLPGVQAPKKIQDVYTREQVYPLAFQYHIDRSDALLDAPQMPDFEAIKADLHEARHYAINKQMEDAVQRRLNHIERFMLVYKAEVAASRNTLASLEQAIEQLEEAAELAATPDELEQIRQKTKEVNAAIDEHKTQAQQEPAKAHQTAASTNEAANASAPDQKDSAQEAAKEP